MFLRWVRVPLIFQHLQRRNQLGACETWFNHLVDVAARGSDVGIGELLSILSGQFIAPGFRVCGAVNLALEENVYRALRPHYRNLCCWPGVIDVPAYMLAIHYIVRAAIGFTTNHRDLWHSCLAVGVEQFGS